MHAYTLGEITLFEQVGKGNVTAKYMEYLKIDWGSEKVSDIYNKINLYPFIEPDLYCKTKLKDREIIIKSCSYRNFEHEEILGGYKIRALRIEIAAIGGYISTYLFSGVPFLDSMFVILKRRRVLGDSLRKE
jgi:hypothetical protein